MTTTVPSTGLASGAEPDDRTEPEASDPASTDASGEAAGDAPADASAETDAGGLGDRDAAILEFERQWWKYAGAKEQAIRDRFGLSATRYYQVLNALIDNPAAMARDPILVKRLRRLRSNRQRTRTQPRQGGRR